MKKLMLSFLGMISTCSFAQTWKTEDQYIQKFALMAVEQMQKYKIPASITLAQGLLETGGGQSRLAREGNNHFGIKCKNDWTGKTMKHTDDAPNECFRVYDDPAHSYEDHSLFLVNRKHYAKLFTLDMLDYKAWAHGLKKAGYATNPRYAYALISKIEKHTLQAFDRLTPREVKEALLKKYPALSEDSTFMAQGKSKEKKEKPTTLRVPYQQGAYSKIVKEVEKKQAELLKNRKLTDELLVRNHPNGGLKYIVVPQNMELKLIADKYEIPMMKLQRWNELSRTQLNAKEIIFLEAKNSEGSVPHYTTIKGDTMHSIAQKFGIKIDKLYSKNDMIPGSEPKIGELIYLQGRKPKG